MLGIDPWGAGGAGSTSASTGSTPAKCAAPNEYCVHPPVGWSRIVALSVSDTPCGGGFAAEVTVGKSDLVGADATCACSCDPPAGQSCGPATLHLWNDASCSTPLLDKPLGPSCTQLGGQALNGLGATLTLPPFVPGACAPKLTPLVPPPSSTVRHVCELTAASGTCANEGSCAPAPDAGLSPSLCIWSEGELPCPGGDFSNATIVYRGALTDTRGCSACDCMAPSGASCGASSSIFSTTSCGMLAATTTGGCIALASSSAQSATETLTLVPGSCEPIPSSPTGALVGADPITVCCTNPLL